MDLFKACYIKSEINKFMKLVEFFLFVKKLFKQIYVLQRIKNN